MYYILPMFIECSQHFSYKQEEKSCVRLPAIWKKYKNLARISLDEVEWMEVEIMRAVK